MKDREFLFEYGFASDRWGISIFAADEAEAREKIKAVAFAQYKGELFAKIPAGPRGANAIPVRGGSKPR